MRKAETARTAASKKLAEIAQKLNEKRTGAEAENVVLNEKRTLAATSAERRRSAQAALKRIENENAELEARRAQQNSEIIETENKAGDLQKSNF